MLLSLITLVATTLSCSVLACDPCTPGAPGSCITQQEAQTLAYDYENTWTGQFTNFSAIMVPNFQAFENFGQPDGDTVPWANTTAAFQAAVVASLDPTQNDFVVNSTAILGEWVVCDTIIVNWKSYGLTTGLHANITGVGAGMPISYKGIDILTVDLQQRKLSQVVTSEDTENLETQLGYTLQGNKLTCS